MKSVDQFLQKKENNEKISVITCYDFTNAAIVAKSDIDAVLVGDSLAMVIHGFESTLSATSEMMAMHTAAVRRGALEMFIIADLPFLAHRQGKYEAVRQAGMLMQAGANAVKLEGAAGNGEVVEHLVQSGIPVMGHLGLTPQSVNSFGGYKVQGKSNHAAEKMIEHAHELQNRGCFSIVLECIPSKLAAVISTQLAIPAIGIGAGAETDGQVLVIQDMLGLNTKMKPRFVRNFADGAELTKNALNDFHKAVTEKSFPLEKESYK